MIVLEKLGLPIDISIPLHFDGPQPNAFGVEPATAAACEYGSLVGDTRRGGGCNFERVTFIPHCNGTHTECVGHVTNERISLRMCLQDVVMPALLVSVEPTAVGDDLVIVDIGHKSEGEIPLAEFQTAEGVKINIGDKVEVYLDTFEDNDGGLQLTAAARREMAGLQQAVALPFMQIEPRTTFNCSAPLRGWDPAKLAEAVGHLRSYHDFTAENDRQRDGATVSVCGD